MSRARDEYPLSCPMCSKRYKQVKRLHTHVTKKHPNVDPVLLAGLHARPRAPINHAIPRIFQRPDGTLHREPKPKCKAAERKTGGPSKLAPETNSDEPIEVVDLRSPSPSAGHDIEPERSAQPPARPIQPRSHPHAQNTTSARTSALASTSAASVFASRRTGEPPVPTRPNGPAWAVKTPPAQSLVRASQVAPTTPSRPVQIPGAPRGEHMQFTSPSPPKMKPDPEATEFDADGESNAEGESESADEDKDEDVRPNRPVRVVDEEDGEEEMSEPEHDFVDETEEEDKDKDGASTEKAGKRAYDSASDSDSDSRSGVLSKSSKRPKLAATPPRVHPRSAPIGAPPTPQSPHMKNLNHLSKHQHQPQPQYLDLQALAKQALQEPPASRPLDMPLPLTQSTLAFMESVNNHFKLGAARQSVEPPRVQAPAAIPESQSTILASSSRTSEPEAARDPNSVAPNAATPQQAAVAHAQRPYHCEAGTCRLCHAVTHMLHWVHTLAIFRCEDE